MDLPFIEEFNTRIGFAKLANMDQGLGVRANWDELPAALSTTVKGKRPSSDSTSILRSGLGNKEYCWSFKEDSLLVEIFVSGVGPAGAQQAFLDRLATATMGRLPHELRPEQLGDLAIYYPPDPNSVVMWVCRNVFVYVGNGAAGFDMGPTVQAIQRFMEARKVSRLVDHLPLVDQVKVSAKEIHVGDQFKVSIVLGRNTPLDSVKTDFTSSIDLKTREIRLAHVSSKPLEVTYRAEKPGQATIDVQVMDRRTLLSPPISITVDVLPAR